MNRGGGAGFTFDGDAFTGPLLFEGGEALPLADADDVLLEVELLGVEAQEAQPQLSHRLAVGRRLREESVLRAAERQSVWILDFGETHAAQEGKAFAGGLTRSSGLSQKKAFQPSTMR